METEPIAIHELALQYMVPLTSRITSHWFSPDVTCNSYMSCRRACLVCSRFGPAEQFHALLADVSIEVEAQVQLAQVGCLVVLLQCAALQVDIQAADGAIKGSCNGLQGEGSNSTMRHWSHNYNSVAHCPAC